MVYHGTAKSYVNSELCPCYECQCEHACMRWGWAGRRADPNHMPYVYGLSYHGRELWCHIPTINHGPTSTSYYS